MIQEIFTYIAIIWALYKLLKGLYNNIFKSKTSCASGKCSSCASGSCALARKNL